MAKRLNQTSQHTFTDDPAGTLRYQADSFELAFDDTYLRNHIETIAIDGLRGTTGAGVAIDTTSDDDYNTIVNSINTQLKSGGERQALAEYHLFLYKDPALRLPALPLNGALSPSDLWSVILGLDISNAITVQRFATTSDVTTLELNVEGVKQSCKPGGPWRTFVMTSPRDTRTFLQVAHATRGKVGTTAANKIPGVGQLR